MENVELLLVLLVELIGSGAGAFLGYRYGLKQDRKMRREEEVERKKSVIESLITEISNNKTILGKGLNGIKAHGVISIYYLPSLLLTDAFDARARNKGHIGIFHLN